MIGTWAQGHGAGSNQLPAALGQTTSAASMSVVLASDYTLPVTISTAVNNPMWVELTDGTTGYVGAKTGQFPSNLGQQVKASSLSVTLASDQGALAVSQSGAWSVSLAAAIPAGANVIGGVTQSGAWTIDGIPTTLGQKTMAGSTSVVLASDQSNVPVTIENASIAVTGTFWQATQPISAAALPLPTGASTAANQTTANTSLASIDSKLTHGQATMAASVPVTLASDQSALPVSQSGTWTVSQGGRTAAWHVRNDYSVTNVTNSAYVQLIASTANPTTRLRIFDSSGAALVLATGGAGSEVDQLYIPPGGMDGAFELTIAAGTRVSVKSVDTATVSTGQLLISAFS